MYEVLCRHDAGIARSRALARLGLHPGEYFLVTMHRQENVDVPERLASLMEALGRVATEYELPVICSLHPRTAARLQDAGLTPGDPRVRLMQPFGLFDFVALERSAFCALSDSGTVQEECCIFGVPNVTLRDVTERPETLDCGSNILSGVEPDAILRAVRTVRATPTNWTVPPEYLTPNVSSTAARIVLGHLAPRH
jgi:UDP-N-acetylglucosamine 2-epimerase (non-hydrolysing)